MSDEPIPQAASESAAPKPQRKRWGFGKKLLLGVVLAILVAACFPGVRQTVRGVYDLWQKGAFKSAQKKDYSGTNIENLTALHTALKLFHDSEGQFPDTADWMDAIEPRLKTYIYGESAMKKLVRPDLLEEEGQYGYALNDACAGKYIDDIPNPDDTPLVFVSTDTGKNAHGDPKTLLPNPPLGGGNVGISVSGKILKL